VLIIRDGAEAVGFMSARVGMFSAIAVGSPFCDYQGPVLKPGVKLTSRELVAGLKVARIDLYNTPLSMDLLKGGMQGRDVSFAVDLSEGYEAYAKGRKAAKTDVLVDCRKKKAKLEREQGEVVFTPMSRDPAALEQLLAWKRAQFAATNQPDVLARDWVQTMIRLLFEEPTEHMGGALFTLHVDGQLAAAHFSLRGADVLHSWLIAHDERFCRSSPGCLLIHEILQWAPQNGFTELDFGPVDYGFKERFSNLRRHIGFGFVGRPAAATWARATAYAIRNSIEAMPLGRFSELPGKAMRRLDRTRALG
jgi:CelD/BcsL family acetyltransferase involved in cellulose biosynthesis